MDDFGERVIKIEDEFGWNMIDTRRGCGEVTQGLDQQQTRSFGRQIRGVL